MFFNCEGTELQNINVTKQIEGMDVTYKSNTRYASGIAVKRSGNEVVLLNTQGKDATFTLSQIADDVKSVEYGQYEGTEWASDAGGSQLSEVGQRSCSKDACILLCPCGDKQRTSETDLL